MHSFGLAPIFQVREELMIGIEVKRQNPVLRVGKHKISEAQRNRY